MLPTPPFMVSWAGIPEIRGKGTEVQCLIPSSGNILAFQQQWDGAAKNNKKFVCFLKKGLAIVGHGLRSGQVPNSILNKLLITLPNVKGIIS